MSYSDSNNVPLLLLVEDDPLIGLSIQDQFEESGWQVSGYWQTRTDAGAALRSCEPDFAIVDIRLRDGDCIELIHDLRAADVPFVLYTALDEEPLLDPELRRLPLISKPVVDHDILLNAAVASLRPRRKSPKANSASSDAGSEPSAGHC